MGSDMTVITDVIRMIIAFVELTDFLALVSSRFYLLPAWSFLIWLTALFWSYENIDFSKLPVVGGLCPWWEATSKRENLGVKVQRRLPVAINQVCVHSTSLKSGSAFVNYWLHISNLSPLENLWEIISFSGDCIKWEHPYVPELYSRLAFFYSLENWGPRRHWALSKRCSTSYLWMKPFSSQSYLKMIFLCWWH